jgi:hypothetical protein
MMEVVVTAKSIFAVGYFAGLGCGLAMVYLLSEVLM